MSSYILGDSWPIRPTWSMYMKESTYRHDYNRAQAQDDLRLPMNQGRGYDNYRQDGPYTDRTRYNEYNNFDRPYGRYKDTRYPDRGYDRRPDDRNGPYTDRGDYNRRGTEDPYIDKRHERRDDRNSYQERPQRNDPPRQTFDDPQMYDDTRYGHNRTTQKDYGDFPSNPRNPRDRPHAYRGEVDKEIDAFHNKVRHRNMEYEYDAQQRLPLNIAPQTEYKSNIQRPARSESGAYLFIRTQKDAMFDIKRSFQRHKSILKMSGHLKGIATPDKISVMGDFTNWHIKSPLIRKGEYWYEQSGGVVNQEYTTDYIILCLWFPSVETAKLWIHYDFDFKIASFPEPYGVEILILPINYIPMNDIDTSTFVMTEYPEVLNKEALTKYIKDPMEDILAKDSKFQRCEPFVVWTDRIIMERGMWVSSRSMITIHRFTSLNQAREFYNDPRIERMRRELKDITRGGRHTSVLFQLVDFV